MRIQIEVSEKQVNNLRELMEKTEIETYKDLFNTSLSVFRWAVEETEAGNEVASVNQKLGKYRVLVTPSLANLAKAARKDAGALVP